MPGSSRQSNGSLNDVRYDFIRQDSENCVTGQISALELCDRQLSVTGILVVFLPERADLARFEMDEQLSGRFKIPNVFWSSVAQNASGLFGCQDTRDAEGELEDFSSYFRFLIKEPVKPTLFPDNTYNISTSYLWHKIGFYVFWTPLNGIVVLCLGLPPSLRQSLSNPARLDLEDPFSFHTILIEKIIELYDASLWSWRDLVRNLEQHRVSVVNPQPDYTAMHEIARHAIHSSETLANAKETMTSLIREHEVFFEENISLPRKLIMASKQTRRIFRSQVTLFICLSLRSKALEERLRNEINLVVLDTCGTEHYIILTIEQAFNTVAQYENRIAVQIGEAAQVDSAAMKTISILGLAFLPGTFICALFSTSFFNFSPGSDTEPQKWAVSEKFWIYWVVAIPLTVVTVVCWVTWQYSRTRFLNGHERHSG